MRQNCADKTSRIKTFLWCLEEQRDTNEFAIWDDDGQVFQLVTGDRIKVVLHFSAIVTLAVHFTHHTPKKHEQNSLWDKK